MWGGRGTRRGGAHGGPQDSYIHRVFYSISDRAEAEASNVVVTGMVPVYHGTASGLFDPGSTYSYVSAYFAFDIDIM